MYLTFEDYQNMGGTITDATTFTMYAFRAESRLNYVTFNRLSKISYEDLPHAVKMCMMELIRCFATQDQALNVGASTSNGQQVTNMAVASQSNDGVSISYNTMGAQTAYDTASKQIDSTIDMYLQDVVDSLGRKVLYRGLYPHE